MKATFTAGIPADAYERRDPRAVFQTVMAAKVWPVAQRIAATARAVTPHQGVADSYEPGVSAQDRKVTAWVSNAHPLFRILEEGTRPHVIEAKHTTQSGKPGFLRFEIGGRVVYTNKPVQHPGTRAQKMLSGAFSLHRPDTEQAISEGVGEYLSESLGGAR